MYGMVYSYGSSRVYSLKSVLALALALALGASACGGDVSDSERVVVYSGRSEELVSPLFEAFEAATGVSVDVRYGGSAELALLIETEGGASPADLFISQSPGALGYLAGAGRLRTLGDDVLSRVEGGFRASDGAWVGITGRVRTLVYNSELVDESELPSSVLDLVDPRYDGRVAVAPSNGSFQDFVTAMRSQLGDAATADWLAGMAANSSPNYPKNSAIVEAVRRGEVDMGLVNHYYNLRVLEADPSARSVNHFFGADDLGALVIVTGAAVLNTSDSPASAQKLLAFLLEDDQQQTLAAETQEYPLVSGVESPPGLPRLNAFTVDTIDFGLLGDDLTGTLELIRSSGIER